MKNIGFAQKILMVRPRSFRSNEETAASNVFQDQNSSDDQTLILARAQREFDGLKNRLLAHGVDVKLFEEPPGVDTPDALFPNNWFAHLPEGKLFLFPMSAANRRREIHPEWLTSVLTPQEVVDLRKFADQDLFLEGTGSLILDHRNRQGYACLSSRTVKKIIEEFEKASGYSIFCFHAVDAQQFPFYHTNVIMALGDGVAILCDEGIPSPAEKAEIFRWLKNAGTEALSITREQVKQFAGNMIQLRNNKNELLWICSETAEKSLTPEQRRRLEERAKIVSSPLPTIERYGGGSARCMIAELFA